MCPDTQQHRCSPHRLSVGMFRCPLPNAGPNTGADADLDASLDASTITGRRHRWLMWLDDQPTARK